MSRFSFAPTLSCCAAAAFLLALPAHAAKPHERSSPCAKAIDESLDSALASAKERGSSWSLYQRRIFQDAALMAKRVEWSALDRQAAAAEASASAVRVADDRRLASAYRQLRVDDLPSSARAQAKDAAKANTSFWAALASVDGSGIQFASCLSKKPRRASTGDIVADPARLAPSTASPAPALELR